MGNPGKMRGIIRDMSNTLFCFGSRPSTRGQLSRAEGLLDLSLWFVRLGVVEFWLEGQESLWREKGWPKESLGKEIKQRGMEWEGGGRDGVMGRWQRATA